MKSVVLVASSQDIAAKNMYSILKNELGEEIRVGKCKISLKKVEKKVLYVREPKELGAEQADAIIVLSRHSGTPGGPIITTHVPGNFGPSVYGGEDRKISIAMPFFMKNFLKAVQKGAEEIGYPIALEPTHHGPSLDTPIAFVEVGSNEENWKDLRACKVVALSVIKALEMEREGKFTPAIAIGGPHLNSKFTEIELTSNYAIGHFVRKLDTEYLDLEMLREAVNRNTATAQVAILDWKGIKGEKRREIIGFLADLGVQVIKTKNALRGE
ncbi:MAG: hypothetical protein DRN90_03415 [Thermoproteota archaeon]|nr:MAG: hypothetical protein DRN90_03415 [Candidatus Korarchaeota archaeon]RLG48725.1 MAG: hypothetical protein DRN92_00385 [Candidatus Korarchaeota archaeon]